MSTVRRLLIIIILLNILIGCKQKELYEVSVDDFAQFVEATNYITDAEKFGWSIVQQDVYTFQVHFGIDWRCPSGLIRANPNDPITQVSYNDAMAYIEWAGGKLPSYEEYWNIVETNDLSINENGSRIFEVGKSNIIGNVWEITTPDPYGRIRLAGGSYLCNKNTCNGTSEERQLYVDQMTGNVHISFAVMR